jgi:hypothetical protein
MADKPKAPDWSDREKFWLSMIYPNCSATDTARIIGRSVAAVRKKARQHKIRNVYARDTWSREENVILTEGWQEHSMRHLRKLLPGRTEIAIIHQAVVLKLGPRFQGMLPINQADALIGTCEPLVFRIAETEGVAIVRKHGPCRNNRRMVDEEAIVAAAKNYFRRETAIEYRRRKGIPEREFNRILKWARVYGNAHEKVLKRYLPEEWDQGVEQYRKEMREKNGKQEG